jgi:hypothetical protein
MENTYLIELLKSLTYKELRSFSTFLTSPFHNKGRYRFETIILYELLRKYAPNYDNNKLTKLFLSRSVFRDFKKEDSRIEKVIAELTKSVRLFLLIENYLKVENSLTCHVDFIQILMERNLTQKAVNLASSIEDTLNSKEVLSTQSFNLRYRVSYLMYEMAAQNSTWSKDLNIKEI